MPRTRTSIARWPVYLIAALAVAVASTAVSNAVRWYGHAIAGAFVDANALVSSIGPGKWDGARQGLQFPDQIIEVDGASLKVPGGGMRPAVFDQAVQRAANEGRPAVRARILTSSGERELDLKIQPLDPEAWWTIAGALFFAAALYMLAGLIALWARPEGKLARSFGVGATTSGLFLFTLFDFHTSRQLVPLFYASFAVVPVGFFFLPLRLPDDAPLLVRWPWLERLAYGVACLLGVACVVSYLQGRSTAAFQSAFSLLLALSFLFLIATVLVRFFKAHGTRRDILRTLIICMVPPYAAIGAIELLLPLGSWNIIGETIAFPALSLAPISIAYAFARHDLFGSRALLSRMITNVLVGAVVCVVAIGLAAEIAARLGVEFLGALIAATVAALVAGTAVPAALRATERRLFRSRAAYKPSVEQLSEELTSITSTEEVARALERTVRRWLPCDFVQVAADTAGWLEPYVHESADSGVRKRLGGPDVQAKLSLPITFAGKHLGLLRVGAKGGEALFTSDDFDLLRTIVNQGALALAYAQAYEELEQRRRQQAAAWRGEREALVETMAAEIAHEVRYPINFFRMLFERVARGNQLVGEDVDLGRTEVDRLERLVSGLRRVAAHRIERRPISLEELCTRAELLLRDTLGARQVEVEVDRSAGVRCDKDQAIQVLVNLLSNAFDAAGGGGRIGIVWQCSSNGSGVLEVWDTGPGFVGDPSRLFAPWHTTKPRGTGLGLAITQRLVRAHGWTITATRRDGRTCFSIGVPPADVVKIDPNGGRIEEVQVA